MGSPVLGFLPSLPSLLRELNEPNPTSMTLSFCDTVSMMISSMEVMNLSASLFVILLDSDNRVIKSLLFISLETVILKSLARKIRDIDLVITNIYISF